jgi:hypothetical protein
MTSPERDYDDILRRALRAAAESIEPAADGLERIRGRVSARRAGPFMLLAEFLDWFRPILRWLESGIAGARSGLLALATRSQLRARSGPVLGWFRTVLARLRPLVAWAPPLLAATGWKAARQRRAAAHRTQPSPTGLRARLAPALARLGPLFIRLGPAASWLRPVIAVAAAVGIVVAGVFALGQAQQFITPTNQITGPAATHHKATLPATNPSGNVPPIVQASPTYITGSPAGLAPAPSCSPSATPTPTATAPSTSPPPTPTPSATPTPTITISPTPTGSPTSTSVAGIGAGASAGQVATTRARQLPVPCSPATRASSKAS